MNGLSISLLLLTSLGVLTLPRRWIALPLLVGGCYLPTELSLGIGPFHFYALRVLLAIALLRIILTEQGLASRTKGLDRLIVAWAIVAVSSSFFYQDISSTLVNRLGLVYTTCITYYVFRVLCRSPEDLSTIYRAIALVLMPVAAEMVVEKLTGHNYFSILGGLSPIPEIRNGSIRAQGPFAHSILAGSVGAVTFPLMVGLYRAYPKTAIAGAAACLAMTLASASSGPLMSAAFATAGLMAWPLRGHMSIVCWSAAGIYVALEMVMNAPAYYILAYIDLTGSSTSWHRAALIDAAISHLPEWWLAGTDVTRHWIAYGVPWSANHIDITNHYLRMGVDGGLPLMLLFIAILAKSFASVGRAVKDNAQPFLVWTLGASLFAHAMAFLGVSFFDQSILFPYMLLACIASCSPQALKQLKTRMGRSSQSGYVRSVQG